ncbi:MAG: SprT-like domain-containing protein, partial [Solirubrobacterales bacterium]
PLAQRPPELTVRRASKRPRSRLGFAIPDENRLSVTAYPGIRRGDLEETLLHELVHLAVGSSPGARRWHGREFSETLRAAMEEGYGLTNVRARTTLHGTYAEALERKRTRAATDAARGIHPDQLELAG